MQKRSFILIDFVGKIKDTGEIFDLTIEEEAKKAGIYNKDRKYEPQMVIIGSGDLIPGVEKQLEKMKVGDEKKFDVEPEQAFGKRMPSALKIVSLAKFLKKNINPVPGMFVDIDGMAVRILSVSGGRVRIDFNHPLAGKELTYKIKIVKEITGTKEKLEEIMKRFKLKGTVSVENDKAKIVSETKLNDPLKKLVSEFIKKWVPKIKKVELKEKG